MGSSTALKVDGYVLVSTHSYAPAQTLTIFRESDKYLRVIRVSDSAPPAILDKPVPADFVADRDEEIIDVGYAASARIARDRLEVMGFTLEATKKMFADGVAQRIAEMAAWIDDSEFGDLWRKDFEHLRQMTFERWVDGFRTLKESGVTEFTDDEERKCDIGAFCRWLIKPEDDQIAQFPAGDFRYFIRAVVETCSPESIFSQEMTDAVSSGYYDYSEAIAEDARAGLMDDTPMNSKVIVLTEGVTDRRILEGSLRLLYPHLDGYFSFMDFHGTSAQGGVGALVSTVKAFAGAGVANRVVALFDNDTAARAAV